MKYTIEKILVIFALIASIFTTQAIADDKPIKIGSYLSITGKGAFLGDPSKKVLEAFVKKINAEGGVLGRQIELVLYDSRTSAKEAVNFARRLISQDEVDVIVGSNTTGETMAVVPFVEKAGIPFITLAGGSIVIDPVKQWVFKTPHTDRISVQRIIEVAKIEGHSKLAVLSGSGGFDQSCRKNVIDLVNDYEIQLVSDEQHGAGDTDMTAQLTTIRRNNPDFMIYCGFGAPTSIVAKNHKQLTPKLPIYMTVGAASKAFVKGAGGAAEGVRVTTSVLLVPEQLQADDPQFEVTKSFVDFYTAEFNEEPSTFAGHAYDALMIAVDAIKRAGSTDKEAVRKALESTSDLAGLNGVFNITPTDHMGLNTDSLRIVEVQSGDFILID